jgi:hypothetical protein
MNTRRELAVLVALSLLLVTCDLRSVPATSELIRESATPVPRPTPILAPAAPPSPLPYPPLSPQPSRTPAPSPWPSSTPTPSPVPSPTPTYPPYAVTPFSIIFLRAGNLWLADVGGHGERQLTTESNEWPVRSFAVSPEGDRVAYVIYKDPPSLDALIKQVQISTGQISVLTGEDDQCSEYDIEWLDPTHIAFRVQGSAVPEYADSSCFPEDVTWDHVVLDLTTGERASVRALQLSQSPNGRFWLTCPSCSTGYAYECSCQYVLSDLMTGQDAPVAEGLDWPYFLGWSPDSQAMLFTTGTGREANPVLQLVIITAATREMRVITPDDRLVAWADWSPDGQALAFIQDQLPDDGSPSSATCTLWLADERGANPAPIPVEMPPTYAGPAMCLAWTPDSSRLVFAQPGPAQNADTIWTVRLDGSDLRPIVVDAYGCGQIRFQP